MSRLMILPYVIKGAAFIGQILTKYEVTYRVLQNYFLSLIFLIMKNTSLTFRRLMSTIVDVPHR